MGEETEMMDTEKIKARLIEMEREKGNDRSDEVIEKVCGLLAIELAVGAGSDISSRDAQLLIDAGAETHRALDLAGEALTVAKQEMERIKGLLDFCLPHLPRFSSVRADVKAVCDG